jgi:hypothetical protein
VPAFVLDVLLVISLGALAAAGTRAASVLVPSGPERLLTTAVLAAAAAVIESLALGLAGLSGSPAALTAAAVLTWAGARAGLPAPAMSPWEELAGWWSELPLWARSAVGAAAGLALALVANILRRPEPGFDGITYHLPEVVAFVQTGHAGSVVTSNYTLPVGSYPITNEVLLSWLTGISHGFAALTLWSPVSAGLLVLAGWCAMRRLSVPGWVRTLALAALIAGPLLFVALPQPGTDLPALSWLACCAALCLASTERTALLGPGIVAFGLAVGTKTTALSLGVIAIAIALWTQRRSLREHARGLGLATVLALLAGGVWYIRNLVVHGSPLWPFYATPWGTPVPLEIRLVSPTMIAHLQSTLFDNLGAYASGISGSAVLILAGVSVPLLARRRGPALAAAIVGFGALAWASAPVTGAPEVAALAVGARSSIRYLLPVFAAGALALALTAADDSLPVRAAAALALAGALVWSLVTDERHSFYLASDWGVLPLGALLGALAALAGGARATAAVRRGAVLAGALVALGAASAAVLALASSRFIARHAAVTSELDAPLMAVLDTDPAYVSGNAPVAAAPGTPGLLAGNRLAHRVSLIAEHASCATVRGDAVRDFVVIQNADNQPIPGHPHLVLLPSGTAQACMAGEAPRLASGGFRIYGPGS